MWKDEQGAALPIVIALTTILFLIATVAISQSLRSRQMGNLHWEKVRVGYAAESGIAHVQARLSGESLMFNSVVLKYKDITVKAELALNPLRIKAIAYGQFGVKQAIVAHLSPVTYRVIRWIK